VGRERLLSQGELEAFAGLVARVTAAAQPGAASNTEEAEDILLLLATELGPPSGIYLSSYLATKIAS